MLLRFGADGSFEVEGEVARGLQRCDGEGISLLLLGDPYLPAAASGGFWATADDLLARWQDRAAAMVDDIDGRFAVVVLEHDRRRAHLLTDRFGTFNLFAAEPGREVLVGDRLPELARALPVCRLDPVGVQSFLLYGMVLGGRTLFEGVGKLAPGTHYVLERGDGWRVQGSSQYWMPHSGGDRLAAADAVELVQTTFTDTLRRSAGDGAPLSLPLTSGKDSRAILSVLYREPTLHCYTHGDPSDPDVTIAGRLARQLGLSHNLYPLDAAWIGAILDTSRRHATSLNGAIDHVRFLHVLSSYDREEGRGGRFYPGAWGNEIFEGKFLRPELEAQRDARGVATAALGIIEDARGADYSLLAGDREAIRAPFLDHLERVVDLDLAWRDSLTATSLRLVQHTYSPHFFSVFSSYLGRRFSVFHAFLSKDAVEALPSVPVEAQKRAALQHGVIARNLPQSVPFPLFSEGNYRFVPATLRNRIRDRYHRSGAPRKLDSVLTRVVGHGLSPRHYFVDYRRWLAEHHRREIATLLQPDRLRCGAVLAPGAPARLLAGLEDGTLHTVHPLTRLLSLELFLSAVG